MNDAEKESLISRYNERFEQFGYSPETLGWPRKRHFLRYRILLEHWALEDASLLDFGCGFGDMHGLLQEISPSAKYTGIDINSNLIAQGKEVHPQAHLLSGDFLSSGLDRQFDFVFSSGVHNLKLDNNREFLEQTFKFFDQHSTQGFAVNFLSNKVDFTLDHTYHADPEEILGLAYQYSNRITLRNDYMPCDASA